MIVMDTARADHLSCYGHSRQTTPILDEFAAGATRFTQAIAPSCWTAPVHASLFTGLFPTQHQLEHHNVILPEGVTTLAESLGELGYHTAGFSNQAFVSSITGLSRGFENFYEVFKQIGYATWRRRFSRLFSLADSGAALTNLLVADWLDTEWDRAKPFFIFINYVEPHSMYSPKRPYNRKFRDSRLPVALDVYRSHRLYNWEGGLYSGKIKFDMGFARRLRQLYDGEIAYLDAQIARLFDGFKQRRLFEEMVTVVTSDHGENIGHHNLIGHQFCLYDSLVHIPLIMRWPDRYAPGEVSSQVQLTDLYATILDEFHIPIPNPVLDNVQPFSTKLALDFDIPAFAEYVPPISNLNLLYRDAPEHDFEQFQREIKMIRLPRHKLIIYANGDRELYDLQIDGAEEQPLSPLSQISEELGYRLSEWSAKLRPITDDLQRRDFLDGPVIRRLRALGYL